MFKQYFEQTDNIEIFPIIGLVLFGIFFTALILWVFTLNKRYIKEMSELPLQDDEETTGNENLEI